MLVPIPGSDGSYNYDPSIPAPSGGGGGGGGGSSNYTITLISAPDPQYPDAPASESYYINCFDENYTYLGGAVKTNEGYWDVYVTGNCTITYQGSR